MYSTMYCTLYCKIVTGTSFYSSSVPCSSDTKTSCMCCMFNVLYTLLCVQLLKSMVRYSSLKAELHSELKASLFIRTKTMIEGLSFMKRCSIVDHFERFCSFALIRFQHFFKITFLNFRSE